MSNIMKSKIRSEFGIKFNVHFGIKYCDDKKLYKKEWIYWKNHNHKCRWEEE